MLYFLGLSKPLKSFSKAYSNTLFSAPIPKSQIHIERGHFLVKIADTAHELNSVFALRQSIFQREFRGKTFSLRSDREHFDDYADFLIIIDKRYDKVVGTYRMISKCPAFSYYSASEFQLGYLPSLPGEKLELSRACIHRKYRTGTVMQMLWRGVSAYSKAIGARYLFGCSSVLTVDPKVVAGIVTELKAKNILSNDLGIEPREKYSMKDLATALSESPAYDPKQSAELPALFRSYLKAGAKVHGLPAVDWNFRCVDFLTVLDLEQLNAAHERKFLQ